MKKSFFFVVIMFLVFLLTACSFTSIPKGKFLEKYESPSKKYYLNIYIVMRNATAGNSIRGELVNIKKNNKKTIYWSYHESEAEVVWEDDHTVKINGRTLDVRKDVYDFRQHESDW